jgi:hypothetical protein
MFWSNCRASSGRFLIRCSVQLIMLSICEITYQLYTPPTQRSACSLAKTCSWTITWYNLTEYKAVYDYIIYILYYNFSISTQQGHLTCESIGLHSPTWWSPGPFKAYAVSYSEFLMPHLHFYCMKFFTWFQSYCVNVQAGCPVRSVFTV